MRRRETAMKRFRTARHRSWVQEFRPWRAGEPMFGSASRVGKARQTLDLHKRAKYLAKTIDNAKCLEYRAGVLIVLGFQ